MDPEIVTALRAVLGPLGSTATADELERALRQSLTWDEAGYAPAQPGYTDTYDLNWAAAAWLDQRAATAALEGAPQTMKVSSEGTTIEASGGGIDYQAAAAAFRALSPIARLLGRFGVIEVTNPAGTYQPTSDRLR